MKEMDAGVARRLDKLKRKQRLDAKALAKLRKALLEEREPAPVNLGKKNKVLVLN